MYVRAINRDGIANSSTPVRVSIAGRGESAPPPTPVPTSTFTPTPTRAPATTVVPLIAPTVTVLAPLPPILTTVTPRPILPPPPPPPVGCIGSPSISSFSASPASIVAGASSVLSWGAVTNADSVEIDHGIGGVGTPGSRNVTPGTTTTYTLTARCGGTTATRTATVTVSAPPPAPTADTFPPTITSISESADPIWYGTSGCSGSYAVTISASASDPSGVAEVTLFYKRQGTVTYFSKTMSPTGGGNYTSGSIASKDVAGGGSSDQYIEYYVSARDSKGNLANSSIRTVRMRYCLI